MKETATTILWPSKLKIGAKSKKDPQVKVIGFPEPVEKAKELICKDLDTKVEFYLFKLHRSVTSHVSVSVCVCLCAFVHTSVCACVSVCSWYRIIIFLCSVQQGDIEDGGITHGAFSYHRQGWC